MKVIFLYTNIVSFGVYEHYFYNTVNRFIYGIRNHKFDIYENTINTFFTINIFGLGLQENELLLIAKDVFKKEVGHSVPKLLRVAEEADDSTILIYHLDKITRIHEKLFELIINKI